MAFRSRNASRSARDLRSRTISEALSNEKLLVPPRAAREGGELPWRLEKSFPKREEPKSSRPRNRFASTRASAAVKQHRSIRKKTWFESNQALVNDRETSFDPRFRSRVRTFLWFRSISRATSPKTDWSCRTLFARSGECGCSAPGRSGSFDPIRMSRTLSVPLDQPPQPSRFSANDPSPRRRHLSISLPLAAVPIPASAIQRLVLSLGFRFHSVRSRLGSPSPLSWPATTTAAARCTAAPPPPTDPRRGSARDPRAAPMKSSCGSTRCMGNWMTRSPASASKFAN